MEDKLSLMELKDKEVTQEVLYDRVEELKCFNAALLAENNMFEWFISRIGLQDLASQDGGASQLDGGGHGRRRRSRSNISDRLQLLTLEQKMYMVQREVTETQQDQEKLQKKYSSIRENYKVVLKEAQLRLAEIRKAQNRFERKVLKPLKDNKLEMKESDKVLQYIEDKAKITQLDKMNLENQSLKAQKRKLQQQIQQKKEAGKIVYEDIFQDLNDQGIHKNPEELQVNNLKLQHILRSHKEKLQSVTLESAKLSNDITNKTQMLAKIEGEIQHAEEEHLKAQALNQHLRRQMTDYQAPDITEYMQVKDKHKKLQQSIHTWERKVGIAEMALKTHSKARSTQRATLPPAHSADAGATAAQH